MTTKENRVFTKKKPGQRTENPFSSMKESINNYEGPCPATQGQVR